MYSWRMNLRRWHKKMLRYRSSCINYRGRIGKWKSKTNLTKSKSNPSTRDISKKMRWWNRLRNNPRVRNLLISRNTSQRRRILKVYKKWHYQSSQRLRLKGLYSCRLRYSSRRKFSSRIMMRWNWNIINRRRIYWTILIRLRQKIDNWLSHRRFTYSMRTRRSTEFLMSFHLRYVR